MMGALLQNIRFALRLLVKDPSFTLIAVLTLALGIGANTAIFSLVNGVLWASLVYEQPQDLMMVWFEKPKDNARQQPMPVPDFQDFQAQSQVFEQLAALRPLNFNLSGQDDALQVSGARVSVNLFSLLRVKPILGRTFLPAEGQPGQEQVLLMSHNLWQQHYGGDPQIVGQAVRLNGRSYQVVGVLPPDLERPIYRMDVWVPFVPLPGELTRTAFTIQVIGRLKPGETQARAQAEMSALMEHILRQFPDSHPDWGVRLVPLVEEIVGSVRRALWVLFGAVGLVLLIACTNVANLLLARAISRRGELAIRTALGASRRHLIEQLLTESILLGIIGGGLGLLLSIWGVPALIRLGGESIPRAHAISTDQKTLLFTLTISLLTSLLFGLAPILQLSERHLSAAIKEGRQSGATGGQRRLFNSLVVAEVALALVLLIGAGLLIRSYLAVNRIESGFQPQNVLTVGLSLSPTQYPALPQQAVFYNQLLEKVQNTPGVTSAAVVTRVPLLGTPLWTSFLIQGRAVSENENPVLEDRVCSPRYFETMGIPLLAGRDFTARDQKDSPPVIIISQAMAQQYWPHENPLGKRIWTFPDARDTWREVVGVVGDVKLFSLEAETKPVIYLPLSQSPFTGGVRIPFLVTRSNQAPENMIASIRAAVRAIDPEQPVSNPRLMEEIVARSLLPRRFNLFVLVVFAALAALLAGCGVYGVMAYSVTQRKHEVGIRVALGARPSDILRLLMGQGLRLVLLGVALGLGGAMALTRWMSNLLFGVSATDPLTFALIALLLMGVALMACWLPARRAMKVDPIIALRYE